MNTIIRRGLRECGVLSRTPVWAVLAVLLLSLTAATASAQEQRRHQIFWGHAAPQTVSHFVVLVADQEGDVNGARQIQVGKPQGTPSGNYTVFSALVDFEPDEFLAVMAVGLDGQASIPSDWSGMPPTRPGQPLPPE